MDMVTLSAPCVVALVLPCSYDGFPLVFLCHVTCFGRLAVMLGCSSEFALVLSHSNVVSLLRTPCLVCFGLLANVGVSLISVMSYQKFPQCFQFRALLLFVELVAIN